MQEDWLFLWAAADELEAYLLSAITFWPLETKKGKTKLGQLPPLTVGNICLARRRLSISVDFVAKAEVQDCLRKYDDLRNRWRSNWALKAENEYSERLRLWKNYCDEVLTDVTSSAQYSTSVRQRVILELLQDEILRIDETEARLLTKLDDVVRVKTVKGDFIWDQDIISAFPIDRFWFLYRNVRG